MRYGARVEGGAAGGSGGGLAGMYMGSRGRGLGPEVKRRILMGTYALSAGYYGERTATATAPGWKDDDDERRSLNDSM